MAEYMNCELCGMLCKKTGRAQKYCPACRRKKEREWEELKNAKRRKSVEPRKSEVGAPRPKPQKPKSDVGAGCKRWKRCKYGAADAKGGVCNYSTITGKCKVIEKDGIRMVAPTRDCVFYEPKGNAKYKPKPMTVRRQSNGA